MKAVVLAAGEGTRMRPLTDDTPKPLLPVAGKPILEHTIELLRRRVDEVIVVAGYLSGQVERLLDGRENVKVVQQEERRGTAHAAAAASEEVDGRTAIVNGDDIFSEKALDALEETNAVVCSRVDNPEDYGLVTQKGGEMKGIEEKPEDPSTDLVNTGFYVVEEDFFELLEEVEESSRGELEITDAVKKYEKSLQVVEDPDWQPCSYPWQLVKANDVLMEQVQRSIDGEVSDSARIEGDVRIESGAEVGPYSVVEGPAILKKGSRVGPHSYVRPGTVLHREAEVSGSEVKNSVLREGASIPHKSYVGDSYLGKNVNVGAGTKVANLRNDSQNVRMEVKGRLMDTGMRKLGTVIGSRASIGVNCSIKPGRWVGFRASVDAHEKLHRNVPTNTVFKDGELV